MNNLELSNANGLEDSIVNALGVTSDNYSNCCGADGGYYYADATPTAGATEGGGAKSNIDPELVKKGIEIGSALIKKGAENIGKGRTSGQVDVDAVCGKKPICVFGGKCGDRKKDYQRCVDNALKSKEQATTTSQNLEIEKARLMAELEQKKLEQARFAQPQGGGDKFLGMSKGVGITVAVVGGLALVVGGIFLVRKMRKG